MGMVFGPGSDLGHSPHRLGSRVVHLLLNPSIPELSKEFHGGARIVPFSSNGATPTVLITRRGGRRAECASRRIPEELPCGWPRDLAEA